METCTVCNKVTVCYVEFTDGTIVCTKCVREMAFQLAIQMDDLTIGVCSLCNGEYYIVNVFNRPICTDCASLCIRSWFEPESE